jgi:hypothetical protein
MAANTNNLPENAPERVVGFTTGWLSYPPVVIPGFHEDLANYQPSARPHNHDPGAPSSSRSQAPTNREGELRTSGWELVEEIVIPGALLRSATAWNLRAGANLRVAGPESTDLSVNRGISVICSG